MVGHVARTVGFVFLAWVTAVHAQVQSDNQQPARAETTDKDLPQNQNADSIASSLGPAADPYGFRAFLQKRGIQFSVTYIGETLGNLSGGSRRGAIYEGRIDTQVDADLAKLLGLPGTTMHLTGYQIHGEGLTRYYVNSLYATSGIEALPSTRLYDAWLEQPLGFGNATLRVGQLAADTEFLITQYGGLFVVANFGWPVFTSTDLPAGGPIYPLATPGARLKLAPTENLTILAAVFNGDPAGRGILEPQRLNRTGTSFRLDDPPYFIAEAAFTYNQQKSAEGLPGTLKLGAFYNAGRFNDQRFTATGTSLADPAGSGSPARQRGDPGVYAVLDQFVDHLAGGDDTGVGVFARVGAMPSDRNPVDLNIDAGVTFKGLLPGRPSDTFGVAAGYARLSSRLRGFDTDTRFFGAADQPLRSSEKIIEVTYQAQVVPGLTVQPTFQYIVRPGGGLTNLRDPADGLIRDAAVFGLRTTIKY